MPFDKTKIDLNAPAFGENAQKIDPLDSASETSSDAPQAETKIESEVKEQVVPYSRFQKIHQRAIEAEKEANEAKARYEESVRGRQDPARTSQEVSPDREWIEMFGDSDASKRAYSIDMKRREQLEERAMQKALEAIDSRQEKEEMQNAENLSEIDERLESLSALVGRDLTKAEEDKLLDIVDDYTPKDGRGNYAGELLPFDKAWEILELKEAKSSMATRKSRDSVAGISSARSEGDTSVAGKAVRPLGWSSYQDRLR